MSSETTNDLFFFRWSGRNGRDDGARNDERGDNRERDDRDAPERTHNLHSNYITTRSADLQLPLRLAASPSAMMPQVHITKELSSRM